LDGKIAAPVLLIDDEADSASINTAREDADPTRVNEGIRRLLNLFHRSAYVGFTATPFANVFVDPDTSDAMLGDDLFPRDFVYTLEPPSNYFGPERVFDPVVGFTRWIEDAEPIFPIGHRSGLRVEALPPSLWRAVRSYLVATTIRDIRGQQPAHRSMLVNVSAFTDVQDQTATLIDHGLREVQRDIRNFAALDPAEALQNTSLASLRDTWLEEHDDRSLQWPEIQRHLNDSLQPVVVRAVNQRTGAASLDYRGYGDQGLRVIAVGGNSLSRGLTLEGLSTSYFFRHSQMYDTLMQMGRWFGYRDGYEDLCRVWLTEETQGHYAFISDASSELRGELKRMHRLGLTHRDFGLKVRSHPDALLVTARNKMRRAEEIVREISLSGQLLETSRLRSLSATIGANETAVTRWITRVVAEHGPAQPTTSGGSIWRRVPKDTVADLLAGFQTHQLNYDFQAEMLAEYMKKSSEARLQVWDVVIPSGSVPPEPLASVMVRPRRRRVIVSRSTSSILVSGSAARVGSPADEREGLTIEQVKVAELDGKGRTVPGSRYRAVRDRPLLLIHVLQPEVSRQDGHRDETELLPTDGKRLIALGLSFPIFDDSDIRERVVYKVNVIEWRSLWEPETGNDFEVDDDLDR
jgi:Z1 domain